MPLTKELRQHTAAIHAASEKKMILALKRISSPEDYVHLLNWLYGFYAPMESLIKPWLPEDAFPGMSKRFRADDLLTDIRDTGLPIPPQDTCNDLPLVSSFHQALGALYVLEGSTLGGRVIAGMISRQLGSLKSLNFFNSYGAETDRMWEEFKQLLDQPFSDKERQTILDTAEKTFITFKHWIEKHELQPQL